jgi:hypothetical protein
MANMLVEDGLSYGAYELDTGAGTPAHHCVLRHRDATMDDGAAWGETRTLVHAAGNFTRWQLSLPHAWHATTSHVACIITPPPARHVMAVAQPVSEVWWI